MLMRRGPWALRIILIAVVLCFSSGDSSVEGLTDLGVAGGSPLEQVATAGASEELLQLPAGDEEVVVSSAKVARQPGKQGAGAHSDHPHIVWDSEILQAPEIDGPELFQHALHLGHDVEGQEDVDLSALDDLGESMGRASSIKDMTSMLREGPSMARDLKKGPNKKLVKKLTKTLSKAWTSKTRVEPVDVKPVSIMSFNSLSPKKLTDMARKAKKQAKLIGKGLVDPQKFQMVKDTTGKFFDVLNGGGGNKMVGNMWNKGRNMLKKLRFKQLKDVIFARLKTIAGQDDDDPEAKPGEDISKAIPGSTKDAMKDMAKDLGPGMYEAAGRKMDDWTRQALETDTKWMAEELGEGEGNEWQSCTNKVWSDVGKQRPGLLLSFQLLNGDVGGVVGIEATVGINIMFPVGFMCPYVTIFVESGVYVGVNDFEVALNGPLGALLTKGINKARKRKAKDSNFLSNSEMAVSVAWFFEHQNGPGRAGNIAFGLPWIVRTFGGKLTTNKGGDPDTQEPLCIIPSGLTLVISDPVNQRVTGKIDRCGNNVTRDFDGNHFGNGCASFPIGVTIDWSIPLLADGKVGLSTCFKTKLEETKDLQSSRQLLWKSAEDNGGWPRVPQAQHLEAAAPTKPRAANADHRLTMGHALSFQDLGESKPGAANAAEKNSKAAQKKALQAEKKRANDAAKEKKKQEQAAAKEKKKAADAEKKKAKDAAKEKKKQEQAAAKESKRANKLQREASKSPGLKKKLDGLSIGFSISFDVGIAGAGYNKGDCAPQSSFGEQWKAFANPSACKGDRNHQTFSTKEGGATFGSLASPSETCQICGGTKECSFEEAQGCLDGKDVTGSVTSSACCDSSSMPDCPANSNPNACNHCRVQYKWPFCQEGSKKWERYDPANPVVTGIIDAAPAPGPPERHVKALDFLGEAMGGPLHINAKVKEWAQQCVDSAIMSNSTSNSTNDDVAVVTACQTKVMSLLHRIAQEAKNCVTDDPDDEEYVDEDLLISHCVEHVLELVSTSNAALPGGSVSADVKSMPKKRSGFMQKFRKRAAHMVAQVMKIGRAESPFCVGKKEACKLRDPDKAIFGIYYVTVDKVHMSAKLAITAKKISVGAVAYLVAGDKFSNALGPLAGIGMYNAEASISVDSNKLRFGGRGILTLGLEKTWDQQCSGVFFCLLGRFTSMLVLQPSFTLMKSGDVTLELAIKAPRLVIKPTWLWIEDHQGDGPSIFVSAGYESGIPEIKLGVRFPLKICVERCDSGDAEGGAKGGDVKLLGEERRAAANSEVTDTQGGEKDVQVATGPRSLIFTGELAFTLSPTQTLIEGELKMMGHWYNAFMLPFLHVSHASIAVGVDIKVLLPTKLEVGGVICLGSRETCETKTGDNYLRGGLFVGIDLTNPKANYLMAMMTEVSMEKIFGILGDTMSQKFHQWSKIMPPPLKKSGIYPLKKCSPAEAAKMINEHCYAGVSLSPMASRSITTVNGDVVIPQGFGLRGRLEILGWNIRVEALIKLRGLPKFFIDAAMDPLDIGGILKLGRTKKDFSKGPRFYVDFGHSAPFTAAVVIRGAFKLPPLAASGFVNVTLGHKGFYFESETKVLAFEAKYKVQWKWDFKNFEAQGAYKIGGAGSILAAIANGIHKLVLSAYTAAGAVADALTHGLNKSSKLRDNAVAKTQTLCSGTFCKKALRVVVGTGQRIFQGAIHVATKFFEIAKKLILELPQKLLKKVGGDADQIINPQANIVKALDSIFALNLYEWGIKLDNGNLSAKLKLMAVALGKKINAQWMAKLGDPHAVAQKLFSMAFGFFTDLPANIKKAAKFIMSDAMKKAKDAFTKVIPGIMKKVKAKAKALHPVKIAKTAKKKVVNVARKVTSWIRRRRRRRRWWRRDQLRVKQAQKKRAKAAEMQGESGMDENIREALHDDDDNEPEFGTEEYLDAVVEASLRGKYEELFIERRAQLVQQDATLISEL